MDFKSTLTSWSWWSQPAPPASTLYLSSALGVCIVLFVIALVSMWRYRPTSVAMQNYKRGWLQLLTSCAIGLTVLVFARWQGLAYLGSRVLQGGLAFVFVIQSVRFIVLRMFILPKKIQDEHRSTTLSKYLPKPKRNK